MSLQNRYLLQEQMGSAGIKQTWLALDQESATAVTVKTLYFGQGMDWQSYKLFEREGQILQQLSHPQIPRYLDSFRLEQPEGVYCCLVQTYISGQSLLQELKTGKTWTEAEIIDTAIQILQILCYLQGLFPPVIHRDIKPNNLIRGEDGLIYLMDFGAVQIQGGAGATITVVGTYGYMPPEQFGGRSVPASDLYALGATLLHLLIGIDPAQLPQQNFRLQPGAHLKTISPSLRRWLECMIEPDMTHRFETAAVALKALHQDHWPENPSYPVNKVVQDLPRVTSVDMQLYTSRSLRGSEIELKTCPEYLELLIPAKPADIKALFEIAVPFGFMILAAVVVGPMIPLLGGLMFPLGWSGLAWRIWQFNITSALETSLRITPSTFTLQYRKPQAQIPDIQSQHFTGMTRHLSHARVQSTPGQERLLLILQSGQSYALGGGLSRVELEWLCLEISQWLEQFQTVHGDLVR